ncbi:DNA-protecting protein DprA [Marinomonas agarivorans]|nr:DNA-protecting protein DprA [Marinomonas agarivorans]
MSETRLAILDLISRLQTCPPTPPCIIYEATIYEAAVHNSTHNSTICETTAAYHSRAILGLADWLTLSFIKGVGPARLSRLRQYLLEYKEQVSSTAPAAPLPDIINKDLLMQLKWPETTAKEAIDYLFKGQVTDSVKAKLIETQEWLQEGDHYLISQDDERYPARLREIPVAPLLLYVMGNVDILNQPTFGIVGARRCSAYGRETAFHFSQCLSKQGLVIASGGALGIDSAAHMGALSVAAPTIAVMGTGLKNLYPRTNLSLYSDLLERGGAIISEYPLSTPVKAQLFPPRNRIISGLSLGAFIVEASTKSGSLITASYALQQNRDVFALPGRITDPVSSGTLSLIQQGAKLVTCVDDILEELPPLNRDLEKAVSLLPDGGLIKDIEEKPRFLIKNSDETLSQENVSREITPKTVKKARQYTRKNPQYKEVEEAQSLPLPVVIAWDDSLAEPSRTVIACIDDLLTASSWYRPFDFNELMPLLAVSSSMLSQALIELELSGLIKATEVGYYRCLQ